MSRLPFNGKELLRIASAQHTERPAAASGNLLRDGRCGILNVCDRCGKECATWRKSRETLEGWFALHDFRRIDWPRCNLSASEQASILEEAGEFLRSAGQAYKQGRGASAAFAVLGHKADLMLLHLRPALQDLNALKRDFAATRLADWTTASRSPTSPSRS